jgi:hypothetical protein
MSQDGFEFPTHPDVGDIKQVLEQWIFPQQKKDPGL